MTSLLAEDPTSLNIKDGVIYIGGSKGSILSISDNSSF
jgi:hypothetical protein